MSQGCRTSGAMLKTRKQRTEKRDRALKLFQELLSILQEACKREVREVKDRNWKVKKRLEYKNYF